MIFFLKLATILSAVALLTPAPALAGWVPVSMSDELAEASVDIDSIERDGNIVSFWMRFIKAVPDNKGVLITGSYTSVDCYTGFRMAHRHVGLNQRGDVVYDPG